MFVEKNIKDLNMNPYTFFAKKWAALSTGNQSDGYNAMTIAWEQLVHYGKSLTTVTVYQL